MESFVFKKGGIWDCHEFEIFPNDDVMGAEFSEYKPCPHYNGGYVPFVVVIRNESGDNSISICGDCIREAIQTIEENRSK